MRVIDFAFVVRLVEIWKGGGVGVVAVCDENAVGLLRRDDIDIVSVDCDDDACCWIFTDCDERVLVAACMNGREAFEDSAVRNSRICAL